MTNVKLGQKVRDEITGFTGVVVGRFEYLYGCVRAQVQPQEVKDGKPVESVIFDEGQLVLLDEVVAPPVAATGGPRDAPSGRSAPTR